MKHSFSWNQPSEVFRVFSRGFRKNRTLLVSMSAIVVFIATYMLILPAMTLDEEEAAGQGGIDVPGTEQITDAKAGQTEQSADTGGPAFEGDGYTISLEVGKEAKLPEGTELTAVEVTPEDKDYNAWCDEAVKALQESSAVKEDVSGLKTAKFYDITLMADGSAFEPADAVNVNISYDKALKMKDMDDVKVIHFCVNKKGNLKPEVLKDSAVDVKAKQGKKGTIEVSDVAFEATGFSMYGVVEMETLEKTVITADGKKYKVTVTYDNKAEIPAGSELDVKEIGADSAEYSDYVAQTENALRWKKGSAGYARLFDITIVDSTGKKVAIADSVDVKIELADAVSDELNVVHFGKKPEVVASRTEGRVVGFEAEGFSVYAIVGEGDNTAKARMTIEFYGKDQSTAIADMIVKNDDTIEEMEAILYDPGAGVLDPGDLFMGWTFDRDYSASIVDNPYDPLENPNGLMTIEDIRSWAEAKSITEGDHQNIYAVILKHYTVTYLDDKGVSLGSESAYYRDGDTTASFTILKTFTPDDNHGFEGWDVTDGEDAIKSATYSGSAAETPYKPNTVLEIDGDITLRANAPEGRWLVFDENGKGGTYNAPQFVKSGEVTKRPRPDTDMSRYGYTFVGWYEDSAGTTPFVFGRSLNENKTIYAKWRENDTAPYTVVCWTQNLDRTAYNVEGTYNGVGTVGQPIPFTFVNNGDEDYVTGIGNNGHYTGFTLNPAKTANMTITPEGDAVLNLYFDRITYNMKIYLYRQQGTGNNAYSCANGSNAGKNTWGTATWHRETSLNNMPTTTYGPILSERVDDGNTRYTGYYFVLSAYYGENISSKWPRYDQITGPSSDRSPVSFIMMNGTGLKGNGINDNGYGTGKDTIKGLITTMDEMILGKTNDSNGNFLIVRFSSYNDWRYHIWYETVDGEDYTGKTIKSYNGKTYYEDTVIESRSSNTDVDQQNPPQYSGFKYAARRNQNWDGDDRWRTSNPTRYHINYLYDRLTNKITYFDGVYVDGNNRVIQARAANELHQSNEIKQGAAIPVEDQNYIPDLPEGEQGYVFEGWYLDEACTIPYTWSTMPVGGITVHAKWRQVQYRVFLHPNAGTDPSLNWGSESQAMNFRISYGGKVSAPTGTRDDYEFIGWYTDPSGIPSSMFNAEYAELNELTVTADYNKTTDLTDPMDKWGNGATTNADVDRPWITKKLDLYAKWRAKLDGAEGINVIYDDGEGSNTPTDDMLYLDASFATAQAAPTPPQGMHFKHWVVQRWDGEEYVDTEVTVLPGKQFEVLKDNAKRETKPDHTPENPSFKYTVQLRAEYANPQDETQTFIHFYANTVDKNGNNIPNVTPAPDGNEPKDITTYHNNIQINEAVDILSIGQVLNGSPLYNGYKFLGWAKERDASDPWLKLNDDGITYTVVQSGKTYDSVTQIGADERSPYEDLYAVWEKKTYTVTVQKIVQGTDADNEIPFEFTQDGIPGGATSFKLVGSDQQVEIEGQTYTNTKAYQEVPYQTAFTVTEPAVQGFITTVEYSCENADDSEKNVSNVAIGNGQQLTVDGDITIKFTNTRKTVPIKVVKTDQQGSPLTGAGFTFDGKDFAGNNNTRWVSTMDQGYAVITENDAVPFGTYTLNETTIPAGYNALEGPITIEVTTNTSNQIDVIAKINGKDSTAANVEWIDVTDRNQGCIIYIRNTAGVELPSTGGAGTYWIYILGSALLLGCGITLIVRRRIGRV